MTGNGLRRVKPLRPSVLKPGGSSLVAVSPMRRCGKAYSAEDAPPGAVECPCGKWHVRTPPVTKAAGAKGRVAATRNSGPTPAVRKLVLERDGYACVCCGQSVIGQRYSLGHRLRASQGGRAVASNLITLLGWGGESHHGRIDGRLDPEDEAKGYTIRSWQDPAQVPVMVFSEHGSGAMAWLWDDGQYHHDGPQVMAS